uniref:Uncharacterized protein n=1 Tax=Anopheles minimus TaxID=112268 RepID=A0A182WNB8_9DIPT
MCVFVYVLCVYARIYST